MKKIVRTIVCFLVTAVLGVTTMSLVACSTGIKDNKDEVYLMIWDAGWGIDAYQEIINKYNEGQHDYVVKLDFSSSQESIYNEFKSGTSAYDIFLCPAMDVNGYAYMEPLNDWLDTGYGDETLTIRQKINPSLLYGTTDKDGVIKSLPGNSATSYAIIYNVELFEKVGANIPRTSDELQELCEDLSFNTNEHRAFIHFADIGNAYYNYLMYVWTAQYNGIEGWQELQALSDDAATAKQIYTKKDGRYYALEAFSKCVNVNTVQRASNSAKFTTQQTAFLDGQAMMMVNGGWLQSEMTKNDRTFDGNKFAMMKPPVLSKVIELTPSIEDDIELSEIIGYIDEGKTYEQSGVDCTEEDYAKIEEARRTSYGGGPGSIYIANYSSSVEYSKEFLKYMYSDEASAIWRDVKHIDALIEFDDKTYETEYDYDSWNNFEKSNRTIFKDAEYFVNMNLGKNRLYDDYGLDIFPQTARFGYSYVKPFTNTNENDRADYTVIWADMMMFVDENWSKWSSVFN